MLPGSQEESFEKLLSPDYKSNMTNKVQEESLDKDNKIIQEINELKNMVSGIAEKMTSKDFKTNPQKKIHDFFTTKRNGPTNDHKEDTKIRLPSIFFFF